MSRFTIILSFLLAGLSSVCYAKRVAPEKVEPVFTTTLRIEAPLDDGRSARVQAFDRTDGHLVWTVVVQKNWIRPWLEEDVQWRFIEAMKLVGDDLEVTIEGGSRYRVFLATHKVERLPSLRKTEANQALLPTPTSVTQPAGAGCAPAAVAADL